MTKKKAWMIPTLVIAALVCFSMAVVVPQYQKFQHRARQKEAGLLLSSAYTAAWAFKVELNRYPKDFEEMGYAPAGTVHYKVVMNVEDLPQEYLEFLGGEMKPYSSKEGFRFVAYHEYENPYVVDFWSVDHEKINKHREMPRK